LQPRHLARRALPVAGILVVFGLIVLLTPGLDEVRHLLETARPGWLVLAVAFEGLSCVSYVVMFRPIFCRHMPVRTAWELGCSVPAPDGRRPRGASCALCQRAGGDWSGASRRRWRSSAHANRSCSWVPSDTGPGTTQCSGRRSTPSGTPRRSSSC